MPETTYLIPVWDTIGAAWRKVSGTKGSIWAALIVLVLISVVLFALQALISHIVPALDPVTGIIIQAINFLLQMGILYIGIQRAFDLPITYRLMFRNFQHPLWLKVIGLYILQILIFLIPVLIFFIPLIFKAVAGNEPSMLPFPVSLLLYLIGIIAIIYLAVRLSLSMAFVVDKQYGPVQAVKASFQATRSNFWRLVAIMIIQIFIILISAIPLGIGLIWTIPFAYIIYGIVYKNLLLNVHN